MDKKSPPVDESTHESMLGRFRTGCRERTSGLLGRGYEHGAHGGAGTYSGNQTTESHLNPENLSATRLLVHEVGDMNMATTGGHART